MGFEILALDVLDEGDEERLAIGERTDDRRNRGEARLARGEKPALARDELKAVTCGARSTG
jgi:hypothetical protein